MIHFLISSWKYPPESIEKEKQRNSFSFPFLFSFYPGSLSQLLSHFYSWISILFAMFTLYFLHKLSPSLSHGKVSPWGHWMNESERVREGDNNRKRMFTEHGHSLQYVLYCNRPGSFFPPQHPPPHSPFFLLTLLILFTIHISHSLYLENAPTLKAANQQEVWRYELTAVTEETKKKWM